MVARVQECGDLCSRALGTSFSEVEVIEKLGSFLGSDPTSEGYYRHGHFF